MAQGTIAPVPVQQFFDASGDPLAGAKLYTYIAGTSTPQSVYSDAALTTPLANPAVADSAGRLAFYLTNASYKFVLKTSADVTVWTQDNVAAVPFVNVDLDIAGTAGEALAAGDVVFLSDGSGGQTAGRWYKTDADNTYSSTIAKAVGMAPSAIASAESGSVRIQGRVTGLSGLTAGTAYYISATAGALTSSAPANARLVAVADTTTSVILTYWVALIEATATATGLVSTGAQTWAGVKTFNAAPIFGGPPTFKPGAAATVDATTSGRVSTNTTAVGNVGTGEDNLMSYTLPANALDANGKVVRITAWGALAANANVKTIKAHFGATSITLAAGGFNNGTWSAQVWLIRTGATAQILKGASWLRYGGVADTFNPVQATPAETLSGAVIIKFTGEGTSNDDVTQEGMIVEVVG